MDNGFWSDPRTLEAIKTIVVALLVAVLTVLGYDVTIARKRIERLVGRTRRDSQPH
ncbi:MAG: hypothetical protein GX557_03770 [Chloroflexi bacterium]|nr:hypothetical protein [Chloroflexota bacterium]